MLPQDFPEKLQSVSFSKICNSLPTPVCMFQTGIVFPTHAEKVVQNCVQNFLHIS